jgi:hypothetical protein
MNYTIEPINEKITKLSVDFSDEDIDLQGETTVKGTEEDAEKYVKTFANDLKQNNIELFPKPPEPDRPEEDEELMM